ncbi:MAG: SpoIIE family protein phosphatase [Xenococcaceae cyanobacterium]
MLIDSGTQQTWFSHLRHELRTPVNAIIGYSEMLIEELEELAEEELIADLQKIHASGKQILILIDTFFDSSQLEASASNLDIVKFGETVRVEFRTPLNTVIGYCEMLLEDVANEEFRADLEKIHTASQSLLNSINDIVNLLRQQLQKTDAEEAKPLNIALESTNVDSAMVEEVASTIRSLEENNPTEQVTHQGTILVIDDNEANRELLSRRLEQEGYKVAKAVNGRQALQMIATEDYDLILLDIMMPEMNGYEMLKYLKAHEKWRHIPVIMISALDELDSVVKCIEMGAEDYLPKPFNPVLLRARIGACLEKKRLHDQKVLYLEQLAQANEELRCANQKLESELQIARQIQEMMLPKMSAIDKNRNHYDISACLQPARAVGGDLYDFFLLNGGERLCFVIGDVADKGVPAALFMARTITLVRTLADDSDTPFSILEKTNRELCRDNEQFLFVTLFCALLDIRTGQLSCASAGHEFPLLIAAGTKQVRFLKVETGPPLGIDEEAEFPLWRSQLVPGDLLLLYTDGVTEARSENGDSFSDQHLLEVLIQDTPSQPVKAIRTVQRALRGFVGKAEQWDDITLLSLQYQPSATLVREADNDIQSIITIDNKFVELEIVRQHLSELLRAQAIAPDIIEDVQLIAEEILTNIIKYGYKDGEAHPIKIDLCISNKRLSLTFEDAGKPFNPLDEIADPELDIDIENRPVGGLGIFLVKQLAEQLEYARRNGKNVLKVEKNLAALGKHQ